MKIFSGSANKQLTDRIANSLGITSSPLEIFIFPDQERRIRIEEDVTGENTVIVQPTSAPADTNYMELFFIADALQRSGAKSITAVIPYLGYERQNKMFRSGEAVSLEVIVKTLEAVGVDHVIACDLHSIKIPEVFNIPVNHLSALPLFAEKIKEIGNKDSVLISPDTGGIQRIKIISQLLDNMPYATIEKNRDLASGRVDAVRVEGSLEKHAFIVDDMIASGNTIVKATELLLKQGATEVSVFATHAVFSAEAPVLLQNSPVKEVFVTDTVLIHEEKRFPKLKVLSIADMVAKEL